MNMCFAYMPNVLLIIVIIIRQLPAKVIEGELNTNENWVFLTSYSFKSGEGVFKYDVSYPKHYGPQNMLLYYDSQWPSVYNQTKTCEEKHAVLNNGNNQVINMTAFHQQYRETYHSGCDLFDGHTDAGQWYRCSSSRRFNSTRERLWIVVIDNCQSKQGLRLKYKITMTNSNDNQTLIN